jgi:hypothetical protein
MTKRILSVMFLAVLLLPYLVPQAVWAIPNPRTPKVHRKGPLRVLLFATAPSREYQFVRSLLYREVQKKSLVLGIYLQSGKGDDVDQEVEKEWLLSRFPNLRKAEKPRDKPYCLFDYDVVVAVDPDWTTIPAPTQKLLREWVTEQDGGLILIAGPENSPKLVKAVKEGNCGSIADLYPVILTDKKPSEKPRKTSQPSVLRFQKVTRAHTFLKLDEKGNQLLAGWDEFFYDTSKPKAKAREVRGFYTAYAMKKEKAGTTVLADLVTDKLKLPFLVTMSPGSGKVVYIGSPETWRLRLYREAFHKRFWLQLIPYAGRRGK